MRYTLVPSKHGCLGNSRTSHGGFDGSSNSKGIEQLAVEAMTHGLTDDSPSSARFLRANCKNLPVSENLTGLCLADRMIVSYRIHPVRENVRRRLLSLVAPIQDHFWHRLASKTLQEFLSWRTHLSPDESGLRPYRGWPFWPWFLIWFLHPEPNSCSMQWDQAGPTCRLFRSQPSSKVLRTWNNMKQHPTQWLPLSLDFWWFQ